MQADSAVTASLGMSDGDEDRFSDIAAELGHRLSLRDDLSDEWRAEGVNAVRNLELEGDEDGGRGYDDDDDDYEFSFVCKEASSPVSADEIFDNGQIRPVPPWFGSDAAREPLSAGELEAKLSKIPAEKVFVERSDLPSTSSSPEAEGADRIAEGPYCVWSKRSASQGDSNSTAPDSCRKSNSTGFSKLWRFRDLLHRSHSDGKDTFVFLTPEKRVEKEEFGKSKEKSTSEKNKSSRSSKTAVTVAGRKTASLKAKTAASVAGSKTASSKAKTAASSSSYAVQYGEKGREKRRSYLPYRQDLVGFFTNANAMSRNLHPY